MRRLAEFIQILSEITIIIKKNVTKSFIPQTTGCNWRIIMGLFSLVTVIG